MVLTPRGEYLLVRLEGRFKGVAMAADKRTDTFTSGIVVSFGSEVPEAEGAMLNKRVYFEDYKYGKEALQDSADYTFVHYNDVKGYENE